MFKWTWALVLMTLLVAPGCGKKKKDGGEGGASGKPVATEFGPLQGPLTAERLLKAGDLVLPMQPWDESYAMLKTALGEPTKIDGG